MDENHKLMTVMTYCLMHRIKKNANLEIKKYQEIKESSNYY